MKASFGEKRNKPASSHSVLFWLALDENFFYLMQKYPLRNENEVT